jgi:hypothetical protein
MRYLVLLSLLVGGVASAVWDASFVRLGQVAGTSTVSGALEVPKGAYVKVRCDVAAYVGGGVGVEAACSPTLCDVFPGGEAIYIRLLSVEDRVAVRGLAATATCQVFRAVGY